MSIGFDEMTGLTSEDWAAREQVLRRFEEAWRRGLRPALENYLPASELPRRAVLLELVHADFEYRLKDGEPARVEEYLTRFPELKSDPDAELELITAELELRRRREPGLGLDDFLARFPQYGAELVSMRKGLRHAGATPPLRPTCPQCHERLEIPVNAPPGAVNCTSCGAAIRLDLGPLTIGPRGQSRLGKYELLAEVGRGSFGIVYRARDTELDRVVALKVPRAGHLASPEEEDRFLREARSAARLEHPHIVAIHDFGRAGETCYLACAFVYGTTLADHLAAGRLSFREAAVLVARVANALNYAHFHGVIHRDVKPSNIMLDQAGQPHLTDFGLARRDAGEVTMTLDGEILGTPAYMSPEQARGEGHRVDGRSDLYSLGVILYELLTQALPFRGNGQMVLKQLLEDEPLPPRRLNDRIPRDLETICLKCLEKEPDRRYDSARSLAEDLGRFANGEPILARPVGRAERLGRWCRRNPWAAAFVTALVLGVIGSTWQAIRATGAERSARLAATSAERSEDEARATLEFFEKKVLMAALPKDQDGGLGVDATIRAAVDAAEPEIGKSFVDQPVVEASIRNTLGETYRELGSVELAIRQHERALVLRRQFLGPDHPSTLISMNNLALAYVSADRLDDAIPLHEEDLKHSIATLGPDDRRTLISMFNLARSYREAGRLVDGLRLAEETVKRCERTLGPDHVDTLSSISGLAKMYVDVGRLDDAIFLQKEALKRREATLGPDHSDTLISLNNLASTYRDVGRFDDAIPLDEEDLRRSKAMLGADHRLTLISMNALALDYLPGRPADAERLLRECLSISEKKGLDDWRTGQTRSRLGASLVGQKKYAEAEPVLLQGYEGMKVHEAQIPAAYKKRLAEAGTRIIQLYDAWSKKDKAAEWRTKLSHASVELEPKP
jgi:tetratricopeptide (TPR) repeat protein